MPNSPWASAPRTTPVERARPSPVMPTTRTAGRAPIVATTSLRSRAKLASPALSTSGRSRVRRATGPVTSRRIVLGLAMSQWFTIKGLVTPLIVLLCLLSLSNTFSLGAFPAILPELARGSGLADWQLGVVASAFGFARMTADIPIGLFLTHHLRRAVVIGPGVLAVGAAFLTSGGPFPILVLGRLLMGVGHALGMVAGLTAILHYRTGLRLASALNAYEFSAMIGILCGTVLIGVLPSSLAWNWALLVTCAPQLIGLLALPALLRALPRHPAPGPKPLFARQAATGPDARAASITPTAALAFVAGGAIAVAYSTVEQFAIPLRGSREFGLERAGVARLLLVMQVFDIAALLPLGVLADRRGTGRVLVVTINRPEVMNATNARLHWELTQVWLTVDADREVRVALVTGAGKAFSAGGDLSLVEEMAGNPDAAARTMREASDLVYNMINLDKPVVSAINGAAVGAGLVVALLADVSIIAETARLTDGHTRLGVAAGDNAAIIWPLLCRMATAKYYLLTADFLDGREAERIGLVSLCVPGAEVLPKALDVATRLAQGSQLSIRWTKRALNNWLRQAGPIFDQSLALEMLTFMHPDVREGARALREKRAPAFPSAR